jgi:hypothetical protein
MLLESDDRVRKIAEAMGLIPVIWTEGFDTDGQSPPPAFFCLVLT